MVTGGTEPARPCVLLVEDDDGDAKAVRRAFERAGIENPIVRAIDGVDALEKLRGTPDAPPIARPYVMLVDLNMPRMDGIRLLQEIRRDEALRRTIAFVLTTSKRDEDKVAAYELNVAGYVEKERAGRDFQALMAMLGSYWSIVELPS